MSRQIPGLRGPAEKVAGIVYLGRMLDKIRLHLADKLPGTHTPNLGKGFDERCVHFLKISYVALTDRIKEDPSLSDEDIVSWIWNEGQQPDEEQIEIWNAFMTKRGWHDEATPHLEKRKAESGFSDRADILTMFAYIDADEGRT